MDLRLLAISGSLRMLSTNSALLRALRECAPAGMTVEIFNGVGDLPIFDPDLQAGGLPKAVALLEEKVRLADGLLIASPEYAHGIPGGLKNALDWLVGGSAAAYKPVMLVHASPRSLVSREALREVLRTMSFGVYDGRELEVTLLGKDDEAIRSILADEGLRSRMCGHLQDFGVFILRR